METKKVNVLLTYPAWIKTFTGRQHLAINCQEPLRSPCLRLSSFAYIVKVTRTVAVERLIKLSCRIGGVLVFKQFGLPLYKEERFTSDEGYG